jgi:acyl-CoA synthetase (NDP forming)
MFRARSVAIVGASTQVGSPRNQIVKILIKHGFAGRIYPVTRTYAEVEGHKAYSTLADIPEIPDVALVITPAGTVPSIISECGRKGIPGAIVFSAGFEETAGGKALAQELADAARRAGVLLLGANGQGIWSIKANTILTFGSSAYALETILHAPIAIISQSGALAGSMGSYLQRNGVGCSYIVSVGNETCFDALDALDWVVEQEDVRVALLYIEGLSRADRLIPLAAKARKHGVQIVVLKTGRTARGQEATASHTGKIAAPYEIYLDVLAQAGVIVVDSLGEAMAAADALSLLPDPRLSNDPNGGISIITSSGGAGALLADHGAERMLPITEYGPQTLGKLDRIVPEFGRKQNPTDLTGQVRSNTNLFRDVLAVVCNDPRTEAVVIQFASGGRKDLAINAEAFKDAARVSGLPMIITFAADQLDVGEREQFRQSGILLSDDPYATMRAMKWLYDRRRITTIEPVLDRRPGNPMAAPMGWSATMSFLETAGVTPARWTVLPAGANAKDVCAELTFPLVVKALPEDAEHKTEMGLVKLRVASFDEVDAHADRFRRIVGKPDMSALVQEMICDGVEVVLSCLRDADFGPVLLIGSGGIAIELYKDVTYLAPPVSHDEVRNALKRLKLWTLLQGFRGAPPADVDALVDAVVGFGNAMLATAGLVEAEINPLLVRPRGKGVVAVDFLGKTA